MIEIGGVTQSITSNEIRNDPSLSFDGLTVHQQSRLFPFFEVSANPRVLYLGF